MDKQHHRTMTILALVLFLIVSVPASAAPLKFDGPTPSVSSCGSTPNGSVVGTDASGLITVGGGAVAGCTLTFTGTYTTAMNCLVTLIGLTVVPSVSVSTTQLVLTATLTGGKIAYQCNMP